MEIDHISPLTLDADSSRQGFWTVPELVFGLCPYLSRHDIFRLSLANKFIRQILVKHLYSEVDLFVYRPGLYNAESFVAALRSLDREAHTVKKLRVFGNDDIQDTCQVKLFMDVLHLMMSDMKNLKSFSESVSNCALTSLTIQRLAFLESLEQLQITSLNLPTLLSTLRLEDGFHLLRSLRITNITSEHRMLGPEIKFRSLQELSLAFEDGARKLRAITFRGLQSLITLTLENATFLTSITSSEEATEASRAFRNLVNLEVKDCDGVGWLPSVCRTVRCLDIVSMAAIPTAELIENARHLRMLCVGLESYQGPSNILDEVLAAIVRHKSTLENLTIEGCNVEPGWEEHDIFLTVNQWRYLASRLTGLITLSIRPYGYQQGCCEDYFDIINLGFPYIANLQCLCLLGAETRKRDVEQVLHCIFRNYLETISESPTSTQPPLHTVVLGREIHRVMYHSGGVDALGEKTIPHISIHKIGQNLI